MSRKIHYGWLVCIACMLQLFISTGLPNGAFGVHLPYLIAENGFTNAQGSLIISVRNCSCLIFMLLVDRFYRVLDARRGLLVAGLSAAVSCLVYSFATTLPVYFVGAVFGGAANGLGGMIPISVLISKWFERRRGIALSICSAGSGLATIVLPPVIAALIQQFDLKTAFACESGFILVSAVVVYVVIRNSPVDVGLLPYSIPERAEKTARPTNRLRQDVSKSTLLWLLAIAFGTGITGTSSAFMTMLYTDCGYTETFAAMVFSVMGVVLTVGKFAIGSAMDRWGGFRALSIAYSAMITGLALHCLLFLRSSVLIAVSVSFFGLGMTITTVCISYLAEDFSTEESYGRILKYFQIAHTLALIIFGYVVGVVADLTQGYIAPFVMITCLTAISFAIVIRMYRWKQKNEAL